MPTPANHSTWLSTASITDVGRVRERNEDDCAELSLANAHLLVVADGMGGHRGGATASRLACQAVCKVVGEAAPAEFDEPEGLLTRAFRAANEVVHEAANADPALLGMGTTLVAALLRPDFGVTLAHVGDSRAYRVRDGSLEPLTDDHSVVAALVRQNLLTEEQAAVHPRRNEILRSIGTEPETMVDVSNLEYRAGDRFLLCSDGLCGVLSDAEIEVLAGKGEVAEAARALVEMANEEGGPDNITVQVADLR